MKKRVLQLKNDKMRSVKVNIELFCIVILLVLVSWHSPGWEETAYQNWINIDYVKCMKSKLPCYCEKVSQPFVVIRFRIDEESDSVKAQFYRFDDMEYMNMEIKKELDRNYKIVSASGYPISGYLSINKNQDTLSYYDNNKKKSTFVRFNDLDPEVQDQLLVANVAYLNEAFLSRGKMSMNAVLKQDKLYCRCNKWLGGVNLITGSNASWIIDQRKDSIYIYKYINEGGTREIPVLKNVRTGKETKTNVIKKKLIKRYKW